MATVGVRFNVATATTVTTSSIDVTAGQFVTVMGTLETGGADVNPTISNGGTATIGAWTLRQDLNDNAEFWAGRVWTGNVTGSGTLTVTLTRPTAVWIGVALHVEDNVSSYDSTNAATDTATPFATAGLTPGSYTAVSIGFCTSWGSSPLTVPTATSGWTLEGTGCAYTGTNIVGIVRREFASGTASASFDGGDSPVFVQQVVYIQSGGGGGATLYGRLSLLGAGR